MAVHLMGLWGCRSQPKRVICIYMREREMLESEAKISQEEGGGVEGIAGHRGSNS